MSWSERPARLSPRQSERSADPRGAGADRRERTRPASPSPKPRAGPASARPRPTGISATATSCWPTWRGAASSSSPIALERAWDGGAAGSDRRRSSASARRISPSPAPSPPTTRRCSKPAFRSSTSPELTAAGDRAFAVIRTASETLIAPHAGRQASARADGGAACLVAVARHRVAVRARRRGAAQAADDAPRNCWKPACWSICAGLASTRARPRLRERLLPAAA